MSGKAVKLQHGTIEKLDKLKHPGQSYDGIVREILLELEERGNKNE